MTQLLPLPSDPGTIRYHRGPGRRPASGLVDIVSGSFGAGHDVAAAAIADQLEARGLRTRIWDVVDLMPGPFGRMLRTGYLRQVQSVPGSWRWLLDQIECHDRVATATTRALSTTSGALLELAADAPDLFVSTHPFASQVLGQLRAEGRLDVPVVTYLTDMSVHRLWVHRGVDRHLAIHAVPALQARQHGAGPTTTIDPALSAVFAAVRRTPLARVEARAALGLPIRSPLALVTGGSCGIGRLQQTAREIAATGVTPVVLCGTNRRLLDRVRRSDVAIGLGWVEDMARLLSAVDVVVQNSGGITTLETRAVGVPMITYRCLPGHGETNAAALDAAGIAPWVQDPAGLGPALAGAIADAGSVVRRGGGSPSVADALLGVPALIA